MLPAIRFHFTTPEDSPGFLLWQLSMLWQRRINAALAAFDLTHTRFVLLAATAWLEREQLLVNQTDIADHAGVDRMMCSKVLRKLEQKGWIERREYPADTRAKAVVLTDAGRATLQPAVEAVERVDGDLFSVVGEEVATFGMVVRRLLAQEGMVDRNRR